MKLNTEKSKIMIFNHTRNFQFTSRLMLDHPEVVNKAKLLGTNITDDLKWDVSIKQIIIK